MLAKGVDLSAAGNTNVIRGEAHPQQVEYQFDNFLTVIRSVSLAIWLCFIVQMIVGAAKCSLDCS